MQVTEHFDMESISRFAKNKSGVTSIEYAFIAGLVSIVIVGALIAIGGALPSPFDTAAQALP